MSAWRAILLALSVMLLLVLTGCGGSPDPDVMLRQGRDSYKVVQVPWKGATVECIRFHASRGNATYGGLSCDFEHLP